MIRVFLAEEHAIVRDGLSRLIAQAPGLALAGESGRGREVLRRANQEQWDVLVLDVSLEDGSGLEILRKLRALAPRLPIVVLSLYAEGPHTAQLLRMGASAYLSKRRSGDELVAAIRAAAEGQRHAAAGFEARLQALRRGEGAPHERLSLREYELFLLVVGGRSTGDIAAELNVSASTVSGRLARIRQKLGVRSRGEIIQYAYRAGLAAEQG